MEAFSRGCVVTKYHSYQQHYSKHVSRILVTCSGDTPEPDPGPKLPAEGAHALREVPYHAIWGPRAMGSQFGTRTVRSHVYPQLWARVLSSGQPTGMNQSAVHIHAISPFVVTAIRQAEYGEQLKQRTPSLQVGVQSEGRNRNSSLHTTRDNCNSIRTIFDHKLSPTRPLLATAF